MNNTLRAVREAGFTLLPVVLAMSLIAAIAFLLNRDNGMNAEMIADQSDLDRARYAAEAGLQAANYQVQQKGCGGGFPTFISPVTNSNFGGAAYSAYASKPTGFPLNLISTGTYNGTSVTLARSNVSVFQSLMKTTTLQPGPGTSQDTWLNPSGTTRNYGADDHLLMENGAQALLKFDFSSLPAGSRVIPWYDGTTLQPGANLSLYQDQNSAGAGTLLSAYLITRSWVEGTKTGGGTADGATWNTYDGVDPWPAPGIGYNPTPLATISYVQANGWKSWDITDAAIAWMGTVYPNYGVWMRISSGNVNNLEYVSSDETFFFFLRPKVTVNYLAPCVSGTTVHLGDQHDTQLDAGNASSNYGAATTMGSKGVATELRPLVSFDLAFIPAGTLLKSATLRLYVSAIGSQSGNPKTISAYKLTQSWVAGTKAGSGTADGATWNKYNGTSNWTTAGGTYASTAVAMATEESTGIFPPPGTFTAGWLTWNLTALAQEWIDGISANYGIILVSTVGDTLTFDTRNQGGTTVPELVLTY